jgi:hypothetical protein
MTDTTSPKLFVFVLMPFDPKFDDIYKLGIKGACQEAGAYCERVDEQIFTESILERIYNQIAKADIIVADMTGRNPNVFYETGYAHALGKKVVLLIQNINDIPFDMKHYPHIPYESNNISSLKDELKHRVEWIISNEEKDIRQSEIYLEYSHFGTILTDGCVIESPAISLENLGITIVSFPLSVHNPYGHSVNLENISIGIRGPWVTGISLDTLNNRMKSLNNPISLVDNANLVPVENKDTIAFFSLPKLFFPDAWQTLSCNFGIYNGTEQEFPCLLKLYTEIGAQELTFELKLKESVEIDKRKLAGSF